MAGRAILKQIEEAARQGVEEVLIEPGHYRFNEPSGDARPRHIFFSDYKNLRIDFQGSTLWFEDESSGLVIYRCDNLTVKNVVMDWDPLPFTQGIVTAMDVRGKHFDLRIDEGYERVVPGMAPGKGTWRGARGVVFDPVSRQMVPQRGFSVLFDWEKNADGTYRVGYRGFHDIPLDQSGMTLGDAVVILRRMHRGVRLQSVSNLVLENVTLYSSPFVAFAADASHGDHIIFRNCNILRRPGTNRLLAGNADGINIANSSARPLIESCRMEYLGDDFVNIHGHLARVIWPLSPTEWIVSRLNRRERIVSPVEVEFLDRQTLQSYGKRKVTAEPISWTIEEAQCLADLDHKWHSGDASALAYGKTLRLQKITLDEPIELTGDTIIACEAFSGSGALIRNNSFTGSLARGIRQQSPQVLIENNRIRETMGNGISLQGHAAYWGEGPYVHSATLRGNTLERNVMALNSKDRASIRIADGDSSQHRIIRDITVQDNRIVNSSGSALAARGVEGLSLLDNVIEGYGERPIDSEAAAGANYAIALENVVGLRMQGNVIRGAGPLAEGSLFEKDVESIGE